MSALICLAWVVGVPLVLWLGLMLTDWAVNNSGRSDAE